MMVGVGRANIGAWTRSRCLLLLDFSRSFGHNRLRCQILFLSSPMGQQPTRLHSSSSLSSLSSLKPCHNSGRVSFSRESNQWLRLLYSFVTEGWFPGLYTEIGVSISGWMLFWSVLILLATQTCSRIFCFCTYRTVLLSGIWPASHLSWQIPLKGTCCSAILKTHLVVGLLLILRLFQRFWRPLLG